MPDALFFTRSVAVTKGATPQEAATQVELALEGVSPFPLAQLYYGWYWVPGAENALVFAAYRRRFTAEQVAEWDGAEIVLPGFVAVIGAKVDPATTVIINSAEAMTAVHWADAPVPNQVAYRPLSIDATDEARNAVRDELLREVGGSRKVVDLEAPPLADAAKSDREFVFRSGEFVSHLPASIASALDVRDKTELAGLRNARKRDILLWRVAVGFAATILLLGVGELALMGGRAWQAVREREYRAYKPLVDRISRTHELTNRIEDLRTKRLLPMEMVTQVVGENNERLPADIIFTRVFADQQRGLYTLVIDGRTDNPAQVNAYESALKNLPSVQSAEAKFGQAGSGRATFTLTITFKPGALQPTATAVASSQ